MEYVLVGVVVLVIGLLVVGFMHHVKIMNRDTAKYGYCEVCGGQVIASWFPDKADKKTGKVLRYRIRVKCQSCLHWQNIVEYRDANP